ncbi:MAG TPA: DUF2065 family protein [Rhodanobacteraceae bacterium]|jgi:uncharacterized protein YjeT (DUF2065 family)|nr:DUF2065 family protein [Rhodanobacteraceae bacterium]
MANLAAALCLVLVIEGLFLFASPALWKRMAEQLQRIDDRTLRMIGAGMIVAGLVVLQLVH